MGVVVPLVELRVGGEGEAAGEVLEVATLGFGAAGGLLLPEPLVLPEVPEPELPEPELDGAPEKMSFCAPFEKPIFEL
jgi:hypothetical protein